MNIWVDADGCPRGVLTITRRLAEEKGIPCWTVANYHHEFSGDSHIVVDDTSQSADMEIVNRVQRGDLIITQDLGLAAMVLAKGCRAMGIWGKEYLPEEMPLMLEMREQAARYRRGGGRTKGPRKRTLSDDRAFEETLRSILDEEFFTN